MKKRLPWVDISKGMGICLMYYGHIGSPEIINSLIYAFHMPLFFFLSGFVFSVQLPFFEFVKKKGMNLLKPFFIFGIVIIFINYFLNLFLGENYDFISSIYYMLLQQAGTPSRLWFIPCIFVCEIICYFIIRNKKGLIYFFIFNIFAWINVIIFKINIPWYIDTAIISSFFMLFGYKLKECKINLLLDKYQLVILGILFALGVVVNRNFGRVDIALNQYANPFLFYANALLGIVLCINISMKIDSKTLKYVGQNSLFFMCLNSIAIKIISQSLFIISDFLILNSILSNLLVLLLSLIFVFCCSLLLHKYFNKIMKYIGF